MMKAMVINAYGDTDVFEATEVAKPEATSGHVVVKVAASSVNTVDTMIRAMGKDLPLSPDLPAILGMDFAGTVESVGEGVTAFQVGDEVYGCAGGLADLQGSLAEYMLADAQLIAHKPKSLTMAEAAATKNRTVIHWGTWFCTNQGKISSWLAAGIFASSMNTHIPTMTGIIPSTRYTIAPNTKPRVAATSFFAASARAISTDPPRSPMATENQAASM